MKKSVIVTLRGQRYCKDFELPTDVALEALYPRLLDVLKKDSREFADYNRIILELEHEGLLEKTATLADYGVCSGCYLDIAREESYHGLG